MICQDAAKTYRVRFTPVRKTPGLYRPDATLRGLDITAPQAGPVTVELNDGFTLRKGTAADCRVNAARLACRG